MAQMVKFHQFIEDLHDGVHDFSADTTRVYKVGLTDTLPDAAADAVYADVLGIFLPTADGGNTETLTISGTSGQTGGTYSLVFNDLTISSSGAMGPFRYVVIFEDTNTAPADPLVGYFDYGSSITVNSGESFTIDFTTSVFTAT